MRLRVEPARLSETAGSLRVAADVAREVERARGGLAAHVTGAGSEPVQRAATDFLDAWGRGMGALAERGDALARMLNLAASSYEDVDEQMRHRAGRAESGAP
jgi:hypothetical protein